MGNTNFRNHHEYGVELLAPAGSLEAFYGAVHGGADAVYLAGNRFGARAYAENFTTEALLECIRYGHLMGRKLYLTVNTLLKECELKELYEYLHPFYEAGLDAVIVQDLGVFRFIREQFPGWKLHVSTQMTLCGGYGAALLKEMGACRIVPARELSLRELLLIKKQTDVELETFIHGAMCYCYSGQCLFSSILGGRSGNRGRCAQPCRLKYTVIGDGGKCEDCYPLSLKDLCTIDDIPQLIEAGIDSFKIEGRMKKPEYAAGVTSVYRRCIDKYYELRERMGPEKAAEAYRMEMIKKRPMEEREILNSLYIRSEAQNGYYFRHNGREMITIKSPSYGGSSDELLADIRRKYIDSVLKLPVSVEAEFLAGQPAKVTLRCRISRNHRLSLTDPQRKRQQEASLKGIQQERGISVSVVGDKVEQAQKHPVTEENIKKQLAKLGGSVFYAEEIKVSVGKDVFYPLKQINELRRNAAAKLEEELLSARGYSGRTDGGRQELPSALKLNPRRQKGWAISVHTFPQLETAAEWIASNRPETAVRIYVDGDLIVRDWTEARPLCEKLSGSCSLYAALPYILRAADEEYLNGLYDKVSDSRIFQGFLVRSMDGAGFVRHKQMHCTQETKLSCRTDAGVYMWNRYAIEEIGSLAEGFCLPYELKASEQRELLGQMPCEKIVYGRIPMMITANCLYRTMGQCRKGNVKPEYPATFKDRYHAILKDRYPAILIDRYRREFPVDVNCMHCMNMIYNSVPLSLYSERSKWRDCVDLRMDFTMESPAEVKRLLDAFIGTMPLNQKENTITTGHERRGVE